MRRFEPRRRSVPSEDDIEPPDRQAIRALVGKLSRLINLGLQTWNEASHYQPFDSDLYFEKVKRLKRQIARLTQENAQLQKEAEESPGGTVWRRNTQNVMEEHLQALLIDPLKQVQVELQGTLRDVAALVDEDAMSN